MLATCVVGSLVISLVTSVVRILLISSYVTCILEFAVRPLMTETCVGDVLLILSMFSVVDKSSAMGVPLILSDCCVDFSYKN